MEEDFLFPDQPGYQSDEQFINANDLIEKEEEEEIISAEDLVDQEKQREQHNIEQQAIADTLSAVSHLPISAGFVDKVGKLVQGTGAIVQGLAEAPQNLAAWAASKFIPEEDYDTPEERKAMMEAIRTMPLPGSTTGAAGQLVSNYLQKGAQEAQEESEDLIKAREHGDFLDAFESGDVVEGADMLLGDVIGALPSVGAAMLGAGGLAVVGASAFGNKFSQEFEEDPTQSMDRILVNAASTAGGELLTESFTAGLGGGITKLATKFGPKAAKAITKNAVSKLVFGITGEGLSEGAADTWERISDYAILGDDKAFEGGWRSFAQNAIIGGIIGGGITTAQLGGRKEPKRNVVENVITPGKIKKSQKEAGAKMNQLYDEMAKAQEINDYDTVDLILGQIEDLNQGIADSKKKVADQLEDLSPKQVKDMADNAIKIQNNQTKLDEGTYENEPAIASAIQNEISNLEKLNEDMFTNPVGQDLGKKNPVGKEAKALSKATEEAFINNDFAAIIKNQAGTIHNVARRQWTKIQDVPKTNDNFQDFKTRLESTVAEIVSNYDQTKAQETGTSLAAKIAKELPQRAKRVAGEFTVKGETRSIDANDKQFADDVVERSPLEIIHEFKGIPETTVNQAFTAAGHFSVKLEDIKNVKDYGNQQRKFFEDRLAKDFKKAIKTDYDGFVKSNAHLIKDLFQALPYSKKSSIVREWGFTNPSVKEISDYFRGTDTVLNPENFSKPANERGNRKNSLVKGITEAIGLKAWNDYVESNPEVKKEVNRLNTIKAHLVDSDLTGATAGDFNFTQFQKDTDTAENDFEAQSMHSDKVIKEVLGTEGGKTFDTKKEGDFQKMREWTENVATKYFPTEFFTQGMFANAGQGGAKRGFAYTSKQDVADNIHTKSQSNPTFEVDGKKHKWEDVKRYHYAKKTSQQLKDDSPAIEKSNAANMAALKYMYKKFEQMIKDDPANARGVAAILKSAQNSQNHLSRIAAPLRAYENDLSSGTVEEHTMPQSAVARYMFQAAVNGEVDAAFPNIEKNFFQVLLSKNSDKALKGTNPITGEKFNYTSKMPQGWRPTDNAWARYFNENIIQTNGGIDPNGITLLNGKTVAEQFAPKTGIKAHMAQKGSLDIAVDDYYADYVDEGAEDGYKPKSKESFKKEIHNEAKYAYDRLKDYTFDEVMEGGMILDVIGHFPQTQTNAIMDLVEEMYDNQGEIKAHLKAPPSSWGKRVGAEFRFNPKTQEIAQNLEIADNVADVVPKKIREALQEQYDFAQLESEVDHVEHDTFMVNEFLSNAWEGFGVKATTDVGPIRTRLQKDGYSDKQIEELFQRTVGFAHYANDGTQMIYVDPTTARPETPVHEFGHIWNSIMQEKAPKIFNVLVDKVKTEAPDVYAQEIERLKGYGLDPNTPEGMDEIMAGVIGKHGQLRIQQSKNKLGGIIKQYWKALQNLLGFDFQGKNIQDLTVKEMMDLVVDEVVTGTPGKNLKQLNSQGWVKSNMAKRYPSVRMSLDPKYKGLSQFEKVYKESGDVGIAAKEAFEAVKNDWSDFDEFSDFLKNTIKKVKISKTNPKVYFAEADLIQGMLDKQLSPEKISKSELADFHKVVKTPTRKPSGWLLAPKFEDFEGLLRTLVPKGSKMLDTFKRTLIDPYQNGVTNFYTEVTKKGNAYKKVLEDSGVKLDDTVVGDLNAGDAVKYYIDPTAFDHLPKEAKDGLEAYTKQKKVRQLANIIKDYYGINLTPDNRRNSLNQMVFESMQKDLRKKHIEPFSNNIAEMFDKNTMQQIRDNYGDDYAYALDNIIKRMKTGKNRLSAEPQSKFLSWVQRAVSTTMFWNTRSGVLQMLSSFNYIGLPGNSIPKALATVANVPQFAKDVKFLFSSPYSLNRRKNAAFDVLASDVATGDAGQWISKNFDKIFTGKYGGFAITKLADSFATAVGGASFFRNRVKELSKTMDKQAAYNQAYQEWVGHTETSQQSSDPSKISQVQSDDTGKLIFAFANTPFQYMRIAKKKIQDVATGRSKNPAKDIASAAYYTAGQTALFTGLQTGLIALAFASDDDELKKAKMWSALDRGITGLAKSLGYTGTAAATAYSVGRELYDQKTGSKRKNPADVAKAFLAVSPPLATKFSDIEQVARKALWNKPSDHPVWGDNEYLAKGTAEGISFTTGFPTDKLMRKVDNLIAVSNAELDMYERVLRAFGWGEWDFKTFGSGGRKSSSLFDSGLFDNDLFKDDLFEDGLFDSPLNRLEGTEMGQAHRDGTIEVDPNLSPLERAKTIAHEEQHVRDMHDKGLDYDDNNIYYDGNKYARKNGKINYNGKWHIEGASELPWEARAEKAEAEASPLKNVDDDKKKKNPYQTIKDTETEYRGLTEAQAKRYGWEDKSNQDVRLLPVEGGTRGSVELGGRFYKPGYVGDVSNYKEFEHGPEHFEAAREWTKDWESNPITIQKDIARTGATEEELHHSLDRQRKATVKNKEGRETVAATYDPRTHQIADNPNFKPSEGYGNESVMAHEFAHAGRDLERGLHVKDLIGSIPVAEFNDPTGEFKEYVNRPHEMYGFLQQLRHDLGVKPGQQMTPEQLKAAKKAGNKNPFLNVPVKKIIEVNDKVAYQNNKPSLEDLYNV